MSIKHSKDYEAIGSTPVLSTKIEETSVVTSFKPTSLPINADIISFTLFQELKKSSLPLVPIDIYHSNSQNVTTTLGTLLIMQQALTSFFGKSAVTNHNFIAAPFKPKQERIDNWGSRFVDQAVLLRTLLTSTPEMYQEMLQIYSNQFCLNWLEYEVTPDTWEEWWISRGLAKFYEYYVPSSTAVSEIFKKKFITLGSLREN